MNDSAPGRNPNNWTVLASNDNSTFTTLDTQTNAGATPTALFTYAAGWSLWDDIMILARTVPYMLSRRGM